MRKLLMLSFLSFVAFGVYAQKKVKNDPTYSIHNYKHLNKAVYARAHNLDNANVLEEASVSENSNYKRPFDKTRKEKRYVVSTTPQRTQGYSYKHPYGLGK